MRLRDFTTQHLRAAHWQGYHQAIAMGETRLDGKAMLTCATHKDGTKAYVELAFGIASETDRRYWARSPPRVGP